MALQNISFQLSPRLQAIASLVHPGGVLADIGSDHGYLVTWLAAQGIIEKGLACDINTKPLEHSRSTVLRCGLENKVDLRLSDGLKCLTPGEFSQCVIAGMGGDTISEILSGVSWSSKEPVRYLLQPNSKEDHLREWLYHHSFQIQEEHAVKDGKFVYPILVVEPGEMQIPIEQRPLFYAVGKIGENSIINHQENAYLLRRRKAVLLRLEGKKASLSQAPQQELKVLENIVEGINRRLQGLEGEHLYLVRANKDMRDTAEEYKEEHLQYGEIELHGSAMMDSLPFDLWIRQTLDNASPETVQPNWVAASTFFAVRRKDERVVGMLDVRHRLNGFLQQYGGHIGYGVRPSERKKGYASEMLRLGLKYCCHLGINRVMVSCYQDNEASKKVILKCGGVLEREYLHREGKIVQIYWITLPDTNK
jgi:predicted acetyltransferase/tRNA A22 N-methylase